MAYSAPVTSGEVVSYGETVAYPVEYPAESYPVESYPVESYPVESGSVETFPMDGSVTPVEAGYPAESYQGGLPVETAAPVEAAAPVTEGFSPAGDAPTVDAPTDAEQEPTLAEPPVEPVADPNADNTTQSAHGDATIVVALPSNAKLFVNGLKTSSVGQERQFVSRGLQRGLRYPYQIKAVVDVAGQEVVMTKEVIMTAGEEKGVAFNFDIPVETQLTVRVPEDAELTIAGAKTSSTGSERKFTTRRLVSGQTWSDYKVVVTVNRGGQRISKEQSIELRAGEDRTLTFDFDVNAVASR